MHSTLIVRVVLVASLAAACAGRVDPPARVQTPSPSPAATRPTPVLDYANFKDKVQPIFLAKIDGFARCYVCHSQGTTFRLQRLSEGATEWNEEQSKKNFEAVQRLVTPGDPLTSRLLLVPLDQDAGGTDFHPGGKRWDARTNREWRTIADWINGT